MAADATTIRRAATCAGVAKCPRPRGSCCFDCGFDAILGSAAASARSADSRLEGCNDAREARTALPERTAGRYLVEEELSRGGLAVVYRVNDSAGQRRLALKQLALLAALALSATQLRLLLVANAEREARADKSKALSVLERECARLLALLSHGVFEAALGSPRETMDLVQFLIARQTLRYDAGRWLLPERLDPADLPSSTAESGSAAVASLSPL